MLLYSGERTYPSIISGTKAFRDKLESVSVKTLYRELSGKKHVPMVTQLFWKRNIIYRDLLTLIHG